MRKSLFVSALAVAVAVMGYAAAGPSGRDAVAPAWAELMVETDTITEPFVQLNDRAQASAMEGRDVPISPSQDPVDTFTIR
ncbi:MAG: hypothetical protein ACKO2K_07010, partial [Alphaproteobacteria bacterium]